MKLDYFTDDEGFPFFIQYGRHDEDLFIHTHEDFFELVIVLSGSASHMVDDEKFQISKGDVFVIGNNTAHGYQDTDNFRICNIMFRLDSLFPGNYDITRSAGFHALFLLEPYVSKEYKFSSRLKLLQKDFDKVCKMVDMMHSEYQNKSEGWRTFLQSSFMTLVVILSRSYDFKDDFYRMDIINIAKAISHIENHYNEDISIQMLADLSHYSERHFIRVFRDTYHTTPMNYIISLRIRKACLQLKDSSLSISDIALRCGFNNSNYFSRIFKQQIGITPTRYRSYEPVYPGSMTLQTGEL
jgi:AraC-like DNA-binding protein